MTEFEVRLSDADHHCLVEVRGEIDLATAPALREQLREVLDRCPSAVVVDLHGVPFLDSTGLGVLIAAFKRSAAVGVPLCLVRPQRIVANALSLVRIDTVIPVYDSVEIAVAATRPTAG